MKFIWHRETRIIPSSIGKKGFNWERTYNVQQKVFLFWFNVKSFKSSSDAHEWILNTRFKQVNCKCWDN